MVCEVNEHRTQKKDNKFRITFKAMQFGYKSTFVINKYIRQQDQDTIKMIWMQSKKAINNGNIWGRKQYRKVRILIFLQLPAPVT